MTVPDLTSLNLHCQPDLSDDTIRVVYFRPIGVTLTCVFTYMSHGGAAASLYFQAPVELQ